MGKKKKDNINTNTKLRRYSTNSINTTTLRLHINLVEELDKLMLNIKIPKIEESGEVTFKKYGKSDLIFDLLMIYKIMVKSIISDKELKSKYKYKSTKPYYFLKFLVESGLELPNDVEDVFLDKELSGGMEDGGN